MNFWIWYILLLSYKTSDVPGRAKTQILMIFNVISFTCFWYFKARCVCSKWACLSITLVTSCISPRLTQISDFQSCWHKQFFRPRRPSDCVHLLYWQKLQNVVLANLRRLTVQFFIRFFPNDKFSGWKSWPGIKTLLTSAKKMTSLFWVKLKVQEFFNIPTRSGVNRPFLWFLGWVGNPPVPRWIGW